MYEIEVWEITLYSNTHAHTAVEMELFLWIESIEVGVKTSEKKQEEEWTKEIVNKNTTL